VCGSVSHTIAEHASRPLGHEIRQTLREDFGPPAFQFVELRRDLLERGDPVQDMVPVDRGDRSEISCAGGPDNEAAARLPGATLSLG